MAQVESFPGRFEGMAQSKLKREARHLTPERACEGHRWVRLTVLAAVVQAWMIVIVLALSVPHLLGLFLALGACYSLVAPLLLRYLERDIDRRVITDDGTDSLVSVVHAR